MSYAIPVADRIDRHATALRDVLGHVSASVRLALAAGAEARAARRDQRLLTEFPDYLLKDVGIERGDIPRAIRQGRS